MSVVVSERRRALDTLSGTHRFQLLVEAVKDYAIYLLDPEGYVASWNSGAERIKGYSADEIIGQHFSRFYTPEDRASGLPQRVLETAYREGKFEAEGWRMRKDGTRFWTSIVVDPIIDPAGGLIGFAKVTRDLTERRQAEEEIERAREALLQAQKMEAVGRLTGGVAHDFNNLLTIIRSSIDLLRRPGISQERRNRYLDAISDTTDRAALLTGQLLAFARRQPLRPEPFDIAARIRGLEQIISASLGSPIKVEMDLPDDLGVIKADPNQFETAVLNIVINARDAMPSGGTLRISAHPAKAPRALQGVDPSQPFVAVAIEDDGTGMDEATLGRIFEPFFTTKEINKGTGLGLSQVYGFVKQSGGEIEVTSKVGKGTTFRLLLPSTDDEELPPAEGNEEATQSDALEPSRVLLIEDNEKVGEFASGMLAELGQKVTWCKDAASALALLEKKRNDFDLVFSDIVMPGMDGVQMAEQIRKRWPDLPVVLTSGYSHALIEHGNHGFELLQKPYSMDALVRTLGRRCRRGQNRRQGLRRTDDPPGNKPTFER
jgi:PAS domain S-box-containing protein